MKGLLGAAILATALVLSSAFVSANAPSTAVASHHDISPTSGLLDNGKVANEYAFRAAMRELWEDHIVWTRQVIVSVIAGSPDASAAVDRLLRNQTDIGDAIKPFYGDAAGNELSRLLREHIAVAADVLTAAKAGDSAGVEDALAAWYVNGDAIGAFLADANSRNWDRAEMQAMMRDHLDLTLEEAVARLQGRFADDAAAYDEIHSQILHMADMLSDGIVAQFRGRFGR